MSHKLVLATRNQGKITEFRRILDALAPGAIELIGVDQFPDLVDVEVAQHLRKTLYSRRVIRAKQRGCQQSLMIQAYV